MTSREPVPPGFRRCYGACKKVKPESEFSPGNKRCRDCTRTYQSERLRENPEAYRRHLERNRNWRRRRKGSASNATRTA